jgi:methylaspartate ammonia-lyase
MAVVGVEVVVEVTVVVGVEVAVHYSGATGRYKVPF